jgi:hypothetical protein
VTINVNYVAAPKHIMKKQLKDIDGIEQWLKEKQDSGVIYVIILFIGR